MATYTTWNNSNVSIPSSWTRGYNTVRWYFSNTTTRYVQVLRGTYSGFSASVNWEDYNYVDFITIVSSMYSYDSSRGQYYYDYTLDCSEWTGSTYYCQFMMATAYSSPSTVYCYKSNGGGEFVVSFGGTTYYTVSVDWGTGGTATASKTGSVASGTSVTFYASPSTGYSFSYWDCSDGTTRTSSSFSKTITSNFYAVAYFTPTTYTISASVSPSGAGVVTGAGSGKSYGSSYSVKAVPASGYYFSYWGGDGDYSTSNPITGTVTGNLNFIANFSAIQCAIAAYAGTGGTATMNKTSPVNYGTSVTFTATANSGYSFSYWYTDDGYVYDRVFSKTVTGDYDATAYFTKDPVYYTVSVGHGTGGSASATSTGSVLEGTSVTFSCSPNSGYEFSYWDTSDGTKYTTSFSKTINSNFSATAYFTAIPKYTITYNAVGGTASRGSDYEYRDTVISLPSATMASEQETAYRYTITFNPNEGTVSPTSKLTECTATTSYSLKGWYSAVTGGTSYGTAGSSYTITADRTMYAQWNSSTTYDDSKLSSLPTPTRAGHAFAGWWTALDGGTEVTTSTVFTESKTIYAHWNINSYTVTAVSLNPDYGTVTGGGTYNYGATATFTATPASGYKFDYWSDTEGETITAATYTHPIYADYGTSAVFSVDSQTYYGALGFSANQGTGTMEPLVDSATTTESSATLTFTVPACTFTRSKYQFRGWNTSSDGTGTAYKVGSTYTLVTSSTSAEEPYTEYLYAQWKYIGDRPTNLTNTKWKLNSTLTGNRLYADGTSKNLGNLPYSDSGWQWEKLELNADLDGISLTGLAYVEAINLAAAQYVINPDLTAISCPTGTLVASAKEQLTNMSGIDAFLARCEEIGLFSFNFYTLAYAFNLSLSVSTPVGTATIDNCWTSELDAPESNRRMLTIYGGADATDPDLIDWLYANATLIGFVEPMYPHLLLKPLQLGEPWRDAWGRRISHNEGFNKIKLRFSCNEAFNLAEAMITSAEISYTSTTDTIELNTIMFQHALWILDAFVAGHTYVFKKATSGNSWLLNDVDYGKELIFYGIVAKTGQTVPDEFTIKLTGTYQEPDIGAGVYGAVLTGSYAAETFHELVINVTSETFAYSDGDYILSLYCRSQATGTWTETSLLLTHENADFYDEQNYSVDVLNKDSDPDSYQSPFQDGNILTIPSGYSVEQDGDNLIITNN